MMYRFEEFFFNEAVGTFIDLTKMLAIVFVVGHWMACLFTAVSRTDENLNPDNWINKFGVEGSPHFQS